MRIKHFTPPPPATPQYQAPTQTGARGLGARQAELFDRLRRGRPQQGQANPGKAGKRPGKGIASAELLTDFEQAMDEAYDRLLGRQGRHQQQHEPDDEQGPQDEEAAPYYKFQPRRLRG